MSIFTPTYTPNVALEYCCQQETRDEIFLSMTPLQATCSVFREEGYTWKEIGEVFGVTGQAVRYWMHKAAVEVYKDVPDLRPMLEPWVSRCVFCGVIIGLNAEMCRSCRRKLNAPTPNFCIDCGTLVGQRNRGGRCRSCNGKKYKDNLEPGR